MWGLSVVSHPALLNATSWSVAALARTNPHFCLAFGRDFSLYGLEGETP
jgi:hypothetical protein